MAWLVVCVLTSLIYCGGGVTKTSGLEQFWTDDYKVFEQVYGKTSDKEIYGATLPPSLNFAEPAYPQASEKKERYLPNYEKELNDFEPYSYGDKFNFPKAEKKEKPAKSTFNFVSYNDFKPISKNTDPETYNYLQRLEEAEKERAAAIKGAGFKPYLNYVGPNPEETDAYKSIQDILDAHEANKGADEDENSSLKYLTYREKNKKVNTSTNVDNNKKKPPRKVNEGSKARCLPGRCRKRSAISYRVRSRPYYRRIKHRIY